MTSPLAEAMLRLLLDHIAETGCVIASDPVVRMIRRELEDA
jgi:hypothetical protein